MSMTSGQIVESQHIQSYGTMECDQNSVERSGRLTRFAYFSPMPPERSGISDYSAELLEPLSKLVDIDVFTHVAGTTKRAGQAIYPYSAYPALARRNPYGLNMYAMGNHFDYHEEIFDLALREPGLVIMHDLSLYDFYRIGFGARRDLLAAEVKYAHGAPEQLFDAWHRPERVNRLEINMLRRIAQSGRALISHSAWGCQVLRDIAPHVPVYQIPMGAVLRETAGTSPRRAALCIPDGAFVAGVFGHMEPEKRVTQVVAAFHDLVKAVPDARLLIAGRSPNVAYLQTIKDAVRTCKLTHNVLFLGEPELADFEDYIGVCDVVVNLRWPTAGETSAIMARAFGQGTPVVTSDLAQFRDYSERFCWRVSCDEQVVHEQLVKILTDAARNRAATRDAGQAAREYVRDSAQWSVVARRYADVIAEVALSPDTTTNGSTAQAAENPLRHVTGVNCIGDITAEVGLGTAARQMMQTILNEGIPASFVAREFPSPDRDPSALRVVASLPTIPLYPTNILFYNINDMHLLSNEEIARLTQGKYMIARWFWELSQLSDEWVKRIDRVDEIWVSSRFTQACLQAVTTKLVTVIPATVEVPISAGATRAHFDLPDDRFIFIFTFAASSTEARKNPFAVIEAFEKAFGRPTRKGSPYLVIKAHYVDDSPELKADLTRALTRVGGRLFSSNYSRQEANDMLACADCYVSLHRAEGFGLGPAESMYLGKPVIATNYSGNVDFMTSKNSYLVNYREREILARDHYYNPHGHLVYKPGMTWAEPDTNHAAELMHRVFENPAERAEKAVRAASDIRAWFSHEAVGRLIRKRLSEIERDRPMPTKQLGDATVVTSAPTLGREDMDVSLDHHQSAIWSLEWSRTRDKTVPFQKIKGLGTALRILARVVVQGRSNERQQWINTYTYDEMRTLAQEVAALKRQTGAAAEIQLQMKQNLQRVEEAHRALIFFMLRYVSAIGAIEAQLPELAQYPLISLSEEDNDQINMLVSAVPRVRAGQSDIVASSMTPQEASLAAGIVWYHASTRAVDGDRAEFFKHVYDRLSDDDAFVLISNADLSTVFDVGLLHAAHDERVPGGLRATVVRRPGGTRFRPLD